VDRVCTDPNLERTISDYSEWFRGKLAIVVTKTDEGITDDLADALLAKGEDIGSFDETKATIAELKELLKTVKRKLKSANLTPVTKCALRDQEDSVVQRLQEAESERFESRHRP
jgi:type II secretory pathway component PulF